MRTGDPELDDLLALGPIGLSVCVVLAVLIALQCHRVEQCASTPCDDGRAPTLLDGECLCTAPD